MALSTYFPAVNIIETSTRLEMSADIGATERFVITGSGFKYDSRGALISGTISGLQYYIGAKLDQTITVPSFSAAKLYSSVISKADGLLAQIEGWGLPDLDANPLVTAKQIRFTGPDGSSLQLLGTFSPDNPDIGTVTAVRHLSISGAVLHQATGMPLPTKLAMMALLPSTAIFSALTEGTNIVRAAKNADTHFLDGGLGADVLIGSTLSSTDYAEYSASNAAVTVSLATGKAFGGMGNDVLYYIESVTGSRYSDAVYGNAVTNTLDLGGGNDKAYGAGSRDFIYGGAGSDTIDGGAGDDIMQGDANNDVLYGRSGGDSLDGGDGNDNLYGGIGSDILTGGAGKDNFIFDTAPPGTGTPDGIFDFKTADDTIMLDDAVFTALGTPAAGGTIASGAFWTNETGAAHDADDRIIVKSFAGFVSFYYDSDGTGAAASVQVASFSLGVTGTLTYADFKII